jgi:hypothetical protein
MRARCRAGCRTQVQSGLQNALDSDNDLSEMASAMLQMLMDARSKLLQTVSGIEKGIGNTDMAIAGNIKF